ncbi:hypothetical protein CFII64_21175 [Pseudomonas sp. CFII64]|uniref:hypothetical protein n=1 Tax=Pseudomonas sp. CFII64 TaxID=911242 RepID=UPI0003576650|nr:hypothetical protein [Pseudomonas sp. CFII64]EPJ79332.1 hypothetical protein CFII64_21175 [Pseudomonas sp. CFII64]
MNNTNTRFDYAAPFVSVADPLDGLIKVTDLDEPLRVDITQWDGARPGYFVQLMLDGNLIGAIRTFSENDRPGDVFSLEMDNGYLTDERAYTLGFRSTNHQSLLHDDSPVIPLIVDRTAPGAAMLAAMVFDNASCSDSVTGLIPGYAGMQTGDVIQSICNDIPGPTQLVVAENLTALPVEITFTREFLESLQTEKVKITYHVTDRAGNQSILARHVELNLPTHDSTLFLSRNSSANTRSIIQTKALDAPSIPVAQADGLIPVDALNSDIIIYFPVWLGAHLGIDTNQLMINGVLVGEPVTVPDEATEFSLTIPLATQLKEDGSYDIGYRATSVIGGTPNDSAITTIRIDRTAPGAAMLAALAFPQVNFGDRLIGRLPGYAGMQAGDLVQTICNGKDGPCCLIKTEHLTTPMEITFRSEFLQSLESDVVKITYQITDRAGNRSILAEAVDLTLQS